MTEQERVKEVVKKFENVCIDFATGRNKVGFEEYESARNNLLSEPTIKAVLPDWILHNRYGSQFWQLMKGVSGHYQPRREFIWSWMAGIYDFLDSGNSQPVAISFKDVKSAIKGHDLEYLWRKIHSRRDQDPEGAITASKTMLETTLKYILDELGETYKDSDDLPDLYKQVSKKLKLSPAEQQEQMFKQILQGMTTVICGYSAIRNKLGDAHGHGIRYLPPEKRHVDLAINLSGSMCTFLIETFEKNREQ